jgi:hypothetical protein
VTPLSPSLLSLPPPNLHLLRRHTLIKPIRRLQRRILIHKHPPSKPPRQRLRKLIVHKRTRRHRKDIIQLLERPLLRLRHEEEYHNQRRDIQARVEAEGTGGSEGREDARKTDGEHGGPEKTGCDGPAHAYLAVGEREDFRGVGEGDGAFAGGVEGGEEVDEHGY